MDPPALPISSATVIERDVNCIACGYNLRSRSLDQVCPECGEPVERSVLVLPRPDETAAAIRLAAWALLLGLVLGCIQLDFVGAIIMMIAIYKLNYRCALEHLQGMGKYLKWLWITTVVANVGNLLSVAAAVFLIGSFFSGFSASQSASQANTSTARTQEGQVTATRHTASGYTIEHVVGADNATRVRVVDGTGKTTTLVTEQAVTLPAPDGSSQVVTLTRDGEVSIVASDYVIYRIDPATGRVIRSVARAAITLPAVVDWSAKVAAIAAVFLYLIVCRELALRARDPDLGRQFKTLMWFMIIGSGGMVLSGVLAFMAMGAVGVAPVVIVGVLAVIAWLIASIWQISSSFKLSRTLRLVPRTLDEAVGQV